MVMLLSAKSRARMAFIIPVRTVLDVAIVFFVATREGLNIFEAHVVF